MRTLALRCTLIGVLIWGSVALGTSARARSEALPSDGPQYLPAAEMLELVAMGYEDVVADLLWFRAIQYYGEWRRGDHGIQFFEQLARTTVDLDPGFEDAYRFTGMVLADDMGLPDRGIDFLRLGMANLPDSWWLPFEAGFIEYVNRKDDAAAARWFVHAAAVPGAPEYPRRFAAVAASRAGDLSVSSELWRYVAQTTQNDGLRAKAEQYVAELEVALNGGPIPVWAVRPQVEESR